MSLDEKIQTYNKDQLADLWKRHIEGRLSDEEKEFWPSGKLLEHVVLRALQLEGAEIRWPYSISIGKDVVEQIDGYASLDGYHILIECKDFSDDVNIEPFAKLRNQLMRRPANVIGCIFVRKGFTDPALALSRFIAPQTILLWSGDELKYCLENEKMWEGVRLKYKHAAQEFLFDYNVKYYFENNI